MRVTIEGNLSVEETKELVMAVLAIERHDPTRVVSLFFDAVPSGTVEEWMETMREMGLVHSAVVPLEETEIQFEGGGSVRLVPQDPKH